LFLILVCHLERPASTARRESKDLGIFVFLDTFLLKEKYPKIQENSDCLRLLGKTDYPIQILPISTIVGPRDFVNFQGEGGIQNFMSLPIKVFSYSRE